MEIIGHEVVSEPLWTTEEAAAFLRYTPEWVTEMCRRGHLPGIKRRGRWVFIPSKLKEWLEEHGARS
jgi:excisionase family DNA binding protein